MNGEKSIEHKVNYCPECDGELKPLVVLIGMPSTKCYCPDCDITRRQVVSAPYLCENCHSESFYYKPDDTKVCWFCGGTIFISPSIDEFYEMESNGQLKNGFELSKIKAKGRNGCEDTCLPADKWVRHSDEIYKGSCPKCGVDEYTQVPQWRQREIGKTDEISIWDLLGTQVKTIPYSGMKDLKEKIKTEGEDFFVKEEVRKREENNKSH